MSHCLNPDCQKPEQHDLQARFCRCCGSQLRYAQIPEFYSVFHLSEVLTNFTNKGIKPLARTSIL